ncbi:M3 family oligoendopeptidase [Halocatena pleomorpha]|uniref:Peptidase M3A and M3B thimet/oligopeptidase F n=1 Tax=Halocatena pleomorpha TaxID=1785090 RepID=A0A3P3R3X7_9EURY|nr:M3 family metallopeptidase [Halocatena pleomorpha]RRJ28176.1 peptidase M3A and M3B thimet/oligopeptidase F [Halocatena pleomorpha]
MSLPDRNDIDNQYQWDLTQIFATPADWDDCLTALQSELSAFDGDQPTATKEWIDLLDRIAAWYRRKQRLELYATLVCNVHTDDGAAEDRLRRFRDVESTFESTMARVYATLRTADPDLDLGEHTYYYRNLREQADHARDLAVEKVIAAHEESRTAADRILNAVTTEDFDPPTVERPDGTRVEITPGRFRRGLTHPDRAYRKRVYNAYHTAFDRYAETITTAYAEKITAASTLAAVRGYDSVRQLQFRRACYPETGLTLTLPTAVHDTLLTAIEANLGPWHRARRLRADRLGVKQLLPWDLRAPITDTPEPTIPFETAIDQIVAALAPFGSDYQQTARAFFDAARIDAYPHEHRRNDIGYCPSSADDGAFILMNYQDDVESMFILCHELGHALHIEQLRTGPLRYVGSPRPVSEIPSTLHELLLIEHCLDAGGALADYAQNRLLRSVGYMLYRTAMRSAFTHRLASAVEEGTALTTERISERYADCLETFESEVDWPERADRAWLAGSLTREVYHSYQYVLGVVGALAVRDRLDTGALDPETYRAFLESTGRHPSVELFERVGLDIRRTGPYERAADTFEEYLDRL